MISSYKDLVVWQKSMIFVEEIYRITKGFPKDEVFALTNQIRRSAVSIPSNIAEGRGRSTRKDFIHFLYTAQGSLFELETQILIAKNLRFFSEKDYDELSQRMVEIGKMLHGIIKKLTAGT